MKRGLAIIVTLSVVCAVFSAEAWIYLPESLSDYNGLPLNPHPSFFAVLRAWPDPENDPAQRAGGRTVRELEGIQ